MIENILNIVSYCRLLLSFVLFTYVYKFFYNKCNEKIIVKSKDDKPKKVIRTRIGLMVFYSAILCFIFYMVNVFIVLNLLLIILLFATLLIHTFNVSLLDVFRKYDSNNKVKKIWFIYSIIVNFILKILYPIHKLIDKKSDIVLAEISEFIRQII